MFTSIYIYADNDLLVQPISQLIIRTFQTNKKNMLEKIVPLNQILKLVCK